ncbi:MAG: EAL domain-containing protein [Pseudomonadota bacterium]|nr:EAL domain-containing protein [Pseudomonadota bacterium]
MRNQSDGPSPNKGSPAIAPALAVSEQEGVLRLQQTVLEMVAFGADSQTILDEICRLAERLVPNAVASLMVVDQSSGLLNVRAAPTIPPRGVEWLNGLRPGPRAGSCGNAVYREAPVYVANTVDDACWADLRDFALEFDLRACWSVPVRGECGQTIGSFALTSFESGDPGGFHRTLLGICAHMAGIVLYRDQQTDKLRSTQDKLEFLAYHDPLTGLVNRNRVVDRLQQRLERSVQGQTMIGVFCLDLARFKNINETYGHAVGDALLLQVAARLRGALQEGDTLGRLGGDEFVVLREKLGSQAEAEQLGNELIARFAQPFRISDQDVMLRASIGVSLFPQHGQTPEQLIKQADTSMYQAKERGRSRISFYCPEFAEKARSRVRTESELHRALRDDELLLFYQPQVEGASGDLVGCEALVRWNHPQRGLLGPAEFLGVAEETGLIVALDEWVTEAACHQLSGWSAAGCPPPSISINLSPRQIEDASIRRIKEIVLRSAVPAARVEFELTESDFLRDYAEASRLLDELQGIGCRLALDDFGSGYSSLANLKRFRFDKLKIDQTLVRDIQVDGNDMAIARAAVAVGLSLGLTVVAEGVENAEQKQLLADSGCQIFQGYYWSRPLPADEFSTRFLKR